MRAWFACSWLWLMLLSACASRPPSQPAGAVVSASPGAAGARALSDADSPVPVSPADPSWGSHDAPVTLVLFSDFQCPFCSRVEPALQQVRETYGPDKVRIVWKNEPLPFHPHALPAAEAAMGVFALGGNEAFWKMHARLFANQRDLEPANLLRWAAESGVDASKVEAGLKAGTWREKVEADHAVASHAGVSGTPASYVNGVEVSGAQPFAYFQAVIDEQLELAEAKRREGTPRAQLYAVLSRQNWRGREREADAAEPEEREADKTVYRVPVGQSPTRGPSTALVTLVVFSDFQCPYCKRFEATLRQLEASYGDKIRIVWKDQPLSFHEHARRSAVFAREARAQKGEAGFWAAHAKLFEMSPALAKADLERAARELGLDLKKVQAAVKTDRYREGLAEDEDLAEDLAASGTPHTFVNGRRMAGAQPYERFAQVIDEEIEKAQAAIAAGTPAKDLYASIVRTGKGPDEPERRSVPPAPHAMPSVGPATAKVTVTVFSDYECPFCARGEKTVDELRKLYGAKLRVVARDLPLPMHAHAALAAEAAREAFVQKGNGAYWKMRAALFDNQKELDRQHLEQRAKAAGLDLVRFRAALDNRVHQAAIEADAAAASAAEVRGTPAFFVNDFFLSGAQPARKFRRLIDRALSQAAPAKPAAAKAR